MTLLQNVKKKCKCPAGYYHDERISCQNRHEMDKMKRVPAVIIRIFGLTPQHYWNYLVDSDEYIFKNNDSLPFEIRRKYSPEIKSYVSWRKLMFCLLLIIIFILILNL